MNYADILVYLNDEPGSMDRLAKAAALASTQKARLVALFGRQPTNASVLPTSGEPGYLDPDEIARMDRELENRIEAVAAPLRDRFDELRRKEHLTAEWRVDVGDADIVARHAMYADIVLLGPDGASASMASVAPEAVALKAGRPVIVLPAQDTRTWPPRRILCAWNGRREAVRAVVDATPLLAAAEQVTVMTVTREQPSEVSPPGTDIVHYLSRHGVRVDLHNASGSNGEVLRLLVQQASDLEYDLLVMGAYGRSQLREALLGGVTWQALERVDLPLLMSH